MDSEAITRVQTKLEKLVLEERKLYSGNLAEFTKAAWHVIEPGTDLEWNWHLSVICAYLEAFSRGDIKRLIFNVSPGSMKSILVSVMLPAWMWTWDPSKRMINMTNEASLASRDSRRMRDIIQSDWYQGLWGREVTLSADQQEKTNFENTAKGFRQGLGFKGSVSGKRAGFLILDDPTDTKKAFSDVEIQSVNDTYDQAISTRLNDLDNDGIVLIMQRMRTNDLTGHLLGKKNQHWTHVKIAMEYEGSPGYDPESDLGVTRYNGEDIRDPRKRRGELMFPARFSRKAVEALKEDLGEYGSAGQLQQNPSPLGGGILKKNWWKVWGEVKWTEGRKPPVVKHVFVSMDTAFTDKDLKDNAYTAMTAWGVFWDEEKERDAIIMLWRWFERVDYPDLKDKTRKMVDTLGMREGDAYLIEDKASGQSLLQDLRKLHMNSSSGVQVRGYDPKPDGDKVARAYLTQPMLKAGLMWIPDKIWAHETIEIVGEFPAGGPPCADLTDTITQAGIYLKRRHWLVHPDDYDPVEADEEVTENDADDWRNLTEQKRIGYG